jgi:hypothetical protein
MIQKRNSAIQKNEQIPSKKGQTSHLYKMVQVQTDSETEMNVRHKQWFHLLASQNFLKESPSMTLSVYKPRALDLATHTHNRHYRIQTPLFFSLSPVSPTFRTTYNLPLSHFLSLSLSLFSLLPCYALIRPKPCFPLEGVEPISLSLAN